MKVRFAVEAQHDLVDIVAVIVANNPRAADAFEAAVHAAAERIGRFPGIGRIVHPPLGVRAVVLHRWGYEMFNVREDQDNPIVLTIRRSRRLPLFGSPAIGDPE